MLAALFCRRFPTVEVKGLGRRWRGVGRGGTRGGRVRIRSRFTGNPVQRKYSKIETVLLRTACAKTAESASTRSSSSLIWIDVWRAKFPPTACCQTLAWLLSVFNDWISLIECTKCFAGRKVESVMIKFKNWPTQNGWTPCGSGLSYRLPCRLAKEEDSIL